MPIAIERVVADDAPRASTVVIVSSKPAQAASLHLATLSAPALLSK